MKKTLVRKATITKERFDLEFSLVALSEQFAKMRALGKLDTWANQTGRVVDKMPRVEQITVSESSDGFWNVKFSVDTSIYIAEVE